MSNSFRVKANDILEGLCFRGISKSCVLLSVVSDILRWSLVYPARHDMSMTDTAIWRWFYAIPRKIRHPRGKDDHQRHSSICWLSRVCQSPIPYLLVRFPVCTDTYQGFGWHGFSFRRGTKFPEGENHVGRCYTKDSEGSIIEREGPCLGGFIEGNLQG